MRDQFIHRPGLYPRSKWFGGTKLQANSWAQGWQGGYPPSGKCCRIPALAVQRFYCNAGDLAAPSAGFMAKAAEAAEKVRRWGRGELVE